jgi:hypothetical protein
MQTMYHLFAKELDKLLQEEINRLTEILSVGHAPSFDEYKFMAGQVVALKKAQEYMLDASSNIERD